MRPKEPIEEDTGVVRLSAEDRRLLAEALLTIHLSRRLR